MNQLTEISKKYGANAFLLIAVVYLYNAQLKSDKKISDIEQRLYECYESKAVHQNNPGGKTVPYIGNAVAILNENNDRNGKKKLA